MTLKASAVRLPMIMKSLRATVGVQGVANISNLKLSDVLQNYLEAKKDVGIIIKKRLKKDRGYFNSGRLNIQRKKPVSIILLINVLD